MKNDKSTALVLAGILVLIIASVVSFVASHSGRGIIAGNGIPSEQLLAEVDKPRTGNGLPVKVGEGREAPYVVVTRLDSSELVASYSTCATKPPAPTAPTVMCWQGRQLATIKDARRADAGTSIQEIDKMLSSIQNLMDTDLNKRTTIDGLSVSIIPGGRDTNPGFTIAENIEMKCLGDRARPETPGAVTPIGRQASQSTTLFNNAPRDLIAELKEMKKINSETNARIEPKLASKDSKLTDGENISLIKTALSLHSALSGKHIGVTQEMLNRHYSTLVQTKVPLHFQAYQARDKNGNTINCNSSISKVAKGIAWAAGLGGDFFLTNLKIDELGYTKVCIPDASLLAIIRKDMQAHVERLEKLRAAHEKRQKTLDAELKELAARNYNCPN